jgi:MFS family permease
MGLRGWVPALWVICLLGNFLGALNGGVITLTIPTLAAEFDCTVETAAWVAFAPNFCSAMFGPSLGKLADLYGRARCWWGGMTLFVGSFFLCANAWSIWPMIIGRVLSGIGWAATGPAGFGILASTLERSQRGVASSLMTATGTLGSSIGVAAGGILMDMGSWRLIFSLPIIPLSFMFLVSFFILPVDANSSTPRSTPGTKRDKARAENHDNSFDWQGSVVFALFIGSFLFGVNRGAPPSYSLSSLSLSLFLCSVIRSAQLSCSNPLPLTSPTRTLSSRSDMHPAGVFAGAGNDLGWLSPMVLALMGASLLLLPFLICVERRAANPILPVRATPAPCSCCLLSAVSMLAARLPLPHA